MVIYVAEAPKEGHWPFLGAIVTIDILVNDEGKYIEQDV
jgi:hypothetical protein